MKPGNTAPRPALDWEELGRLSALAVQRQIGPQKIRTLPHLLLAFPVRPERSAAKSKATGLPPSLLFEFAAGAATLRANGECVLTEFHTMPLSCGSIYSKVTGGSESITLPPCSDRAFYASVVQTGRSALDRPPR